eukprot:TRINITY_DN9456_c0_g1_i3.p1 TRINITY_DN9456_c0_g1~~TRINITY_DN9456_c0_g1_i3.p1  ORF type:complete len:231 (-),score=34.78 TRINITY_DN9456_c0_g1_i3:261-953(-)
MADNSEEGQQEVTRVFVGRIPQRATKAEIAELFEKYPSVQRVDIKNGFGFVEFTNADEAEEAIKSVNGALVQDQPIAVEASRGKKRQPGEGRCFTCNTDGHWSRECPNRGRGRDDRRDDRRGPVDDRRGGYDDRRGGGGYDDRPRYDDRSRYEDRSRYDDRRGGDYRDYDRYGAYPPSSGGGGYSSGAASGGGGGAGGYYPRERSPYRGSGGGGGDYRGGRGGAPYDRYL